MTEILLAIDQRIVWATVSEAVKVYGGSRGLFSIIRRRGWRRVKIQLTVLCVLTKSVILIVFTYSVVKLNNYSKKLQQNFPVISQFSTLVRNTVVRATFTVNGKPPIWGSRSPVTP